MPDDDEPGWARAGWSATHAQAPHPRRRLTRRVVRGVKWLERFPLPLTVGTMLVIGVALAVTYAFFCP